MKTKPRVDPFKGVVNPDTLKDAMRKMVSGDAKSKSYCRGALQYLERKPPNPFIVKVLRKAMEMK